MKPTQFSLVISLEDDFLSRYLTSGLRSILENLAKRLEREELKAGWSVNILDDNGNRVGRARLE